MPKRRYWKAGQALVTNPQTVTVGDASITAQAVTSFTFQAGTATGGPYTVLKATVPVSSLTVSATGATGPFTTIAWSPAPTPFVNYYFVCQAVNAQGVSGNSPEAAFQTQTAPVAPTSLTLS
jgi:hypothetical protein